MKAGWRRLVFAAWAVFAVSFIVPAHVKGGRLFSPPLPAPPASVVLPAADGNAVPGWEAFLNALFFGEATGKVSALTNLLMLVSLLTLRRRGILRATGSPHTEGGRGHAFDRWLPWFLAGAGVFNLVYWPLWVAGDGTSYVSGLLAGYWLWAASFLAVALGLWMLARKPDPL